MSPPSRCEKKLELGLHRGFSVLLLTEENKLRTDTLNQHKVLLHNDLR